MRVHLVTDRFGLGGGMEHIYQIVRGLDGIDFRVFARQFPGDNTAESDGVKEKFSELKNVALDDSGFDPKTVLAREVDLIHIHHLRPLLDFFKNPWETYPIPLVFTAHGLHLHRYEFSPPGMVNRMANRLKFFFRFQLEKALFKRVNQVIAVSREDRDFLAYRYRLKNVTYLTNGIDISDFHGIRNTRKELRHLLGLPQDHFLFVTVARFNFQKGHDFLVETLGSLKEFLKNRRVTFVLVGGGDRLAPIKRMADKLGVSAHLIFTGEQRDARKYLKAADVFLLPSRWEGLPIVILECGWLKVPVIASDTYGNREILKNKNGIMFRNLDKRELSAAIKNAVNGRYHWREMTENLSREVRLHYSIARMLSGLKKIYENQLAR